MPSSYKRLGDYIKEVDVRNIGLKVTNLIGLSISKRFIPSVANIIGSDMENYKIIRKNQFACSTMQVRRDGKMPVALWNENDDAIISQAYPVFEVSDDKCLLPEYLMMWFSREEFDREACFYAVGGVRGSLEWEDFLDMKLPIPSIKKQRAIVKEYNTIEQRINLNNQLIQKLEDTAQAIYKHWFVDFEFPNEEGKPHKSSGGKMVYNEELEKEIPDGWKVSNLSSIALFLNGLAIQRYTTDSTEYLPVLKIRELSQGFLDEKSDKITCDIPKEYKIRKGDVIFSWSGSLKVDVWTDKECGLNQHLFKVTSRKYEKWFYYLWTKYYLQEFIRIAEGKAVSLGHIKREHLNDAIVLVPSKNELEKMTTIQNPIMDLIIEMKSESNISRRIKSLLLSRLAKES